MGIKDLEQSPENKKYLGGLKQYFQRFEELQINTDLLNWVELLALVWLYFRGNCGQVNIFSAYPTGRSFFLYHQKSLFFTGS